MAVLNVAGTTLGVMMGTPVIPANATPAAIVAAYDAETYTSQDSCIITGLPSIIRDWEMSQDPVTVCANSANSDLRKSTKTTRVSPNPTVTALMDYQDAFIQILYDAQESSDQLATYEIIHPNGADKAWGIIQVKSFQVDPTDNESRVTWQSEWVYEAWPVFSALV